LQKEFGEQKDRLNRVVDQTKQMIEQAEQSEPLLSNKLYDTLRELKDSKPEEALEATEFLAGRGMWSQSQEAEQAARKGLSSFRRELRTRQIQFSAAKPNLCDAHSDNWKMQLKNWRAKFGARREKLQILRQRIVDRASRVGEGENKSGEKPGSKSRTHLKERMESRASDRVNPGQQQRSGQKGQQSDRAGQKGLADGR
jgi:hypothetical protein